MSFPIVDTVNAWVPHGKYVVPGASAGSLYGLNFAVKDLFDVAGHPTGAGNPSWLETHEFPKRSSPLVDALLAAGAAMYGKVLTDEMAFSLQGDNVHYGTPVNTNAPGRLPGGSSSGSAAAVAAGLVDFAMATDTGGSTRVPASYCGLWGIRTTHGLLSKEGLVPLMPSFDTANWLARDAETFSRVAGTLLPKSPEIEFSRAIRWLSARAEANAEVQPVLDAAWHCLNDVLGFPGQDLPVDAHPPLDLWRKAFVVASSYEAWQVHGKWIRETDPVFAPAIQERWDFASRVGEQEASSAWEESERVRSFVRSTVGSDRVALVPSSASTAPLCEASDEILGSVRTRTVRITCIAGLSGLPQVSVPCRTAGGLPIGIGLIGPQGSDRALISLALRLHNAMPDSMTWQH